MPYYSSFLVKTIDGSIVKRDKLRILVMLLSVDNFQALLREFVVCSTTVMTCLSLTQAFSYIGIRRRFERRIRIGLSEGDRSMRAGHTRFCTSLPLRTHGVYQAWHRLGPSSTDDIVRIAQHIAQIPPSHLPYLS